MSLGTLGSTLNDELNRLANGGTYRDMDDMVDEALAAKQWANRENISPYSTDTVGVLNEIAGLGLDKKNWLDFNGVCNYIAGTSGLPAAAALRQIYPTTDLLTGVASYYVDAATPTNWGSLGYVYLNGVAGNYLSIPDENALDVTGDIDVRVRVALDDWTPSGNVVLFSKFATSGNQRSFRMLLLSTGIVRFNVSTNGTSEISTDSTIAPTIVDGSPLWVRATRVASTGVVKFFTSPDGSTWTQLGADVAGTSGNIFASTARVEIGSNDGGFSQITGKVYNAQILNGIDGTTVLDVNIASNFTASSFNSFTATTGQTVTVNGVDTLANYGTAGSLLPTTVGSSTAADSNDAKFLDHTGTNYVYLPGVSGNALTVPDAVDLRITGDIDVRAFVALDDWTPSAQNFLIAKANNTITTNRGYSLRVNTNGTLSFVWSPDGTVAAQLGANSTVAPTVTDGNPLWVRATLDVDNGASGNDVRFFTSADGTTWTQLGTTVTTAGVTSIFASTVNVTVGADSAYSAISTAKVYRAQVLNGIGGTTVLDVDTSVITAGSATSFTAVTGQTVTINRSTSGRKTVAVTQPTWLFGTDDYMEVNNRYMAHSTSAENYVYLPGVGGNYMSTGDNPPLDVTGDLDLQVKVALDDWTPSAANSLLSKWISAGNQRSYRFDLLTSGQLAIFWSSNGSSFTNILSTVAPTVTDGATLWVRVTLDVDNGAGGNDTKFFTSNDGTTWTQLGSTVTTAGVASIYSGTAGIEIGSTVGGGTQPAKGKFFRAIIKNGIDGTIVLDADASVITLPSQTTFVDRSSNAYTVTINKSGVGTFVSTGNYLYLPGIASNYASTPDAAALDITGDIDLRVKVALDDWTPSAFQALIGKRLGTGDQRSYFLGIDTNGKLQISWSTAGTSGSEVSVQSTVIPTIADGATKWVRATLDVDNGATGNNVTFYTSDDGSSWTQLGTTVTTAGVTSIYAGTALLEVGSINTGTGNIARGKFFRAQVLNGINGTLVFDANFESSITSLLQTSFTESSTNGATVTINRSGSTFRSAGVIDAGYLYPGATNTFSNSTTDFLNFGATDSATVLVFTRQWNTPANFGRTISKESTVNTASGYLIQNFGTGLSYTATISSGTSTSAGVGTPTYTAGSATLVGFVLDRGAQTLVRYMNTTGTSVSATGVGSLSSISPLDIGRNAQSGGGLIDMEFVGAAIFRTALTATQIRQIVNYFANREAYL